MFRPHLASWWTILLCLQPAIAVNGTSMEAWESLSLSTSPWVFPQFKGGAVHHTCCFMSHRCICRPTPISFSLRIFFSPSRHPFRSSISRVGYSWPLPGFVQVRSLAIDIDLILLRSLPAKRVSSDDFSQGIGLFVDKSRLRCSCTALGLWIGMKWR